MVKVVDVAWVADKSLDLYCESVAKDYPYPKQVRYGSKSVSVAAGKIFNSVLFEAVDEYSKKFDFTFVVVPCYPIMRMRHASIITRFICRNSDLLSELGVSSSQFQEFFEKFLSLKCSNEYVTRLSDSVFLLNAKGALFHDWKNAIVKRFGSSLVDDNKTAPFDSNPGFVVTMEDDMDIFMPIGEDIAFKLDEAIEKLT